LEALDLCAPSALRPSRTQRSARALTRACRAAPRRSYRRAVAADPVRGAYLSNQAATLAALGRTRDACDACLAAVRVEPSFQRSRTRLGGIAAAPAGFEHALAAAVEAAAAHPDRHGAAGVLRAHARRRAARAR
jgi:hypothetical protein